MSEEVKEAQVVIPRAMIGTIIVNGILGFGMIIALLFTMGYVRWPIHKTILIMRTTLANSFPFRCL